MDSSCVDLHTQLASIMEVLANAAVAEICQLVDDGFASLRLEVSRSQRENLALKSRLRLMEVRAGERARKGTVPSLVVTCPRRELHFEDAAAGTKRIKSTTLEHHDSPPPQTVEVVQQPVDPEVSEIKREELEEQDPQSAASSNIGPQSSAAQSIDLLSVAAEISRDSASCCFGRLELPQQEETEQARETRASCQQPPAEQSYRAAGRDSNRRLTGGDKHIVDLRESASAELRRSTVTVTVEDDLNTGVKGLCSTAEGWMGETVKLETESSWCEAIRTPNTVTTTDCVSNSRGINSNTSTKNEVADLDTNSLDSSYFDNLFSSPEVARSLTAPQKHSTDATGAMDESTSSSSSFPYLNSRSSFGNSSSTSGCLSGSSITSATSDSRCRSFTGSSTEQVFSCQQCGRLFHASRDLMVHQRSHTGEKIYYCHLCKKAFVHPHQLKTHQRVHTGEKPFSCAQCGKRFSQSSHIKRHMSVHTGEKRYSCSLCGKRFSQACSLKVHQAVHTGERPYCCTKCGKSFSVLGNLVRHQSVHMGK